MSVASIPDVVLTQLPNISVGQADQFNSASSDPLAPHTLTQQDEQAVKELLREESKNCRGSSSQVLTALFKANFVYKTIIQDIQESKQTYHELLDKINKQVEEVEELREKIEIYNSRRGAGKSVVDFITNISWPIIVAVPYVAGALGSMIAVGCRLVAEATSVVLTPKSTSTSSPSSAPSLPSQNSQSMKSSYEEVEWHQVLSNHMRNQPDEKISGYIKRLLLAINTNDTTIVPAYRDVISKTREIKIQNSIIMGEFWKELEEKGLLNTFVEITGELTKRLPDISSLGKRKAPSTTENDDL